MILESLATWAKLGTLFYSGKESKEVRGGREKKDQTPYSNNSQIVLNIRVKQ